MRGAYLPGGRQVERRDATVPSPGTVTDTFPLASAAEAHPAADEGRRGKVALVMER